MYRKQRQGQHDQSPRFPWERWQMDEGRWQGIPSAQERLDWPITQGVFSTSSARSGGSNGGRVNDGLEESLQDRPRGYMTVPWFPNVRMWVWPAEVTSKTRQKGPREAFKRKDVGMDTGWQGRKRQSRKTQKYDLGLLQWVRTALAGAGEPLGEPTGKGPSADDLIRSAPCHEGK